MKFKHRVLGFVASALARLEVAAFHARLRLVDEAHGYRRAPDGRVVRVRNLEVN